MFVNLSEIEELDKELKGFKCLLEESTKNGRLIRVCTRTKIAEARDSK
jgi:hypothetical protein